MSTSYRSIRTYQIQHIEINNNIIGFNMQWYPDHALRLATTTFIEDFLCELRANVVVSTRILTNL